MKSLALLGIFVSLHCLLFAQELDVAKRHPRKFAHYIKRSSDQNCYHNGGYSKKKRRKMFPFDRAAQVEVIAFFNQGEYEFGQLEGDTTSIHTAADSLPKIRNRIILDQSQSDGLSDLILNYGFSKKEKISSTDIQGCWEPRHQINFYDNKGEIYFFIEICFSCARIATTPESPKFESLCSQKLQLYKEYLQRIGITYFGEEE